MFNKQDKNKARQKRHLRVRNHISGTAERPRLNVFRSLSNIYAQVIDDVNGVTLVSASSKDKDFNAYGGKNEAAKNVGGAVAKRGFGKGITEGLFYRGGFVYYGRGAGFGEAAC